MSWIWICFTLGLFGEVSGQLLPLTTKQDGSVVNHITRLEQTVTEFQKKTTQLETDLQVTKLDLQTTKADLKDQQRRSDAEISSLKDELAAVKAEVVMTSDELISAKSEVANLKTKFLSLQASMNQTILDSISHDVKSNMADIKSVKHALEMTNSSLEHFVTEINHFNRTTTAVTTELQKQQKEVKSEISNLSSTLAQIQSNVTSTVGDIYHIKDSVMVVQTELNATTRDINSIKSDVASIRGNIYVEIGRQISQILALKTKPVAFCAMTPTSHISGQPMKFDQVQYNEGNGYNSSTGVFTAPVSGSYMFSVQVELYDTSKAQHTYINIMKSGSLMADSYGMTSPTSTDHITIPVTTVMYVKQGEEVWVQSQYNVDIAFSKGNHFVGALVSAY